MGGRILMFILFTEVLHLVNTFPKNNFKGKLIPSKNVDTRIIQRSNKITSLRQKESAIETDSNIGPNKMDDAKEYQNESGTANGQNIPDTAESLQNKSDAVEDALSDSDAIEDVNGDLSVSDNNQSDQSLIKGSDNYNNTISEDGTDDVDNIDGENVRGNNENPLILDPDNHVNKQIAPVEDHETDDPTLETLKEDEGRQDRSLLAGDTFTPSEMLPITTKLIAKVENPGSGKGIVSSATSPHKLADDLFAAFFLTHKRIVTLKDFDISGLDALQALALSGESADLRSGAHSVTKAPKATINFRGHYIRYDMAPKQSHYRLITKKIKTGHRSVKRANKRRVIDLAKSLAKKRRLVVNNRRRHEHKSTKNIDKPTRTKSKKKAKIITPGYFEKKTEITNLAKRNKITRNVRDKMKKKVNIATTTPKPICRWRYECDNLADLDTCRLHTQCNKDEDAVNKKFIPVKHKEDEHYKTMRKFRKMLGITFVDEEVEKILENRFVHLRPSSLEGIQRIESLSEYFNKIVMAESLGSTTPSWSRKKKMSKTFRLSDSSKDVSSLSE